MNFKEKNRKPVAPKLPKDEKPKQGFNFYWIYGLLALIFIGLQFYNWGSGPKRIEKGELIKMLKEQDIERIDLINKEMAEIFLKTDRLAKYTEKGDSPKPANNTFSERLPDFVYQIGEVSTFEEDLVKAQEEKIKQL